MNVRRALLATVLATATIFSTAACNMISPVASMKIYAPSDGAQGDLGPVKARNLLILSNDLTGQGKFGFMGVFANEDIKKGERIGPVRVGYLRTPIGRYTNHSMNPNCEFNQCLDGLDAYATMDIAKDQEITVCYHAAREAGIEASRRLENRS